MKYFIQIIFFSILFISCREEVISPGNPAGNINEPYASRTKFSYSFTINADNITQTVIDNTYLNTARARIFASVSDYSSGNVEIILKNQSNHLIYSTTIESNTTGRFNEFEGYQPDIITIKFVDFTGKFRVTLTDRD